MHSSINLPGDEWSLSAFEDAAALRKFCNRHGCDGIELILCGDDFSKFEAGIVRGLHLVFFPEWISLWRNDFEYLDSEFGSRAAWQDFYRAQDAEGLLSVYRRELDCAQRLGAQYVVFHMGDNALGEYFTRKPRWSEREQLEASIEFLNCLFGGMEYSFDLLLENMWLGCMNLTNAASTQRALEGVRHPGTGLMLDTGHLMATCPGGLTDPEEACRYIHSVLDEHGGLGARIFGVHLHASLSGAYLAEMPCIPPWQSQRTVPDYIERYGMTNEHMCRVDPHNAFLAKGLPELIGRIGPKYLVHELSRRNMEDWERKLTAQRRALEAVG